MKKTKILLLLAALLMAMPFAAEAQVVVGGEEEYDFD